MARQKSQPDTEGKTDLGGMFYPVGYIVAAFPDEATARRRRRLHRTACRPSAVC
jgi:hypothetical protein